jgi:MFS family permease
MSEASHSLPPAPRVPLPRNVKLLGWASFLNDVASETIFPLLPLVLKEIGAGAIYLGLIEGAAEAVASLLKLFSGGWSDRRGTRKAWIVAGYSLPALIRPTVALVASVWQLLAVRLVDRVGKGLRTSPRDAMIADSTLTAQRGRAFGFHRAMDHLGAALGPVLAAAFLYFWPGEHRTLFLLTILPGLAVLLLLATGLKEVPRQQQKATEFQWSLRPFDRRFRCYLAALALFTLSNSSDLFLIWHAQQLGTAPYLLPLLWFAFHVAKSGGNLLAGGWVDSLGPRRLLVAGWLIYAATYLLFGLASQAWQVWPLFLLYSLHFALSEPAEKTLVTLLAPPEYKGLAFGWFNFTIGLMALPASLMFGAIYSAYGPLAAFGTSAALALLATATVALAVRDRQVRGRKP